MDGAEIRSVETCLTLTCCFLNGQGYLHVGCDLSYNGELGANQRANEASKTFWSWTTKKRFAKSFRRCWNRKDTTAPRCSNGRAAQDQVKTLTPDLVLSDMIMPEMDGIKLLEWLRQYDPEVPVIMVTAIHDISTALEAIRRGAYDYILKPFEKDQLYLGVNRALQHRRLVAENRNYQRRLEQQVEERTARLTVALAQLEQSYDDTLEALGSALDLKDAETEGHCQRVTAFHDFDRQNHAGTERIFAGTGARSVFARHRQDGRSGQRVAKAGATG